MKKETENNNCKTCDNKDFCVLRGILESCPYIQNYMPLVNGDKTRTKKEITDASFNVGVAIVCIIGIIIYTIIFKSCGHIF